MQHQQSSHASGKLQFRAFREQHFGPHKSHHWNQLFLPQWNKRPWDSVADQQQFGSATDAGEQNKVAETRKVKSSVKAAAVKKARKQSEGSRLSEQAIEIFRFSETWRKEKAARVAEQQKEARKEKQTIFPESSAAHMDGTEPPATALVLANVDQTDSSSEIQTLEHLVNFAYTGSCSQDTVLWPVLPLRL